jgi:hypothetical protein
MPPHFGDELKQEAEAAFARMQRAALEARAISARAELMRHMLLAANAVKHRPQAEAATAVVDEWLGAWNQTRQDFAPYVPAMEALAAAFHAYANDPSGANDRAVRDAFAALKRVHDDGARTIEDQMAWRSERALDWWAQVKPVPPDIKRNARAPFRGPGRPFWA